MKSPRNYLKICHIQYFIVASFSHKLLKNWIIPISWIAEQKEMSKNKSECDKNNKTEKKIHSHHKYVLTKYTKSVSH